MKALRCAALCGAALVAAWGAASAQSSGSAPQAAIPAAEVLGGSPVALASVPQQAQIINLNLMNALVAVEAQGLAGLFGFIPEASAAPAFADYLVHNPAALKRFLKKGEQDVKEVGGVNEWDQQVCLYMITIASSGILPPENKLPEKLFKRISALSLAPALPLAEITARRKR